MIELVLHFVGYDPEMEFVLRQETHIAGVFETLEECRETQFRRDQDFIFMRDGIVDRILDMDDIHHVIFLDYCREAEPEVLS